MTSFTKVWVVVSLIRSGVACGAGPPPCSTIVTVSSPDVLKRYFGIRARSSMARDEVPHPLDGGLATKFNPQPCSGSSGNRTGGSPGDVGPLVRKLLESPGARRQPDFEFPGGL